jgi:hypothetical protein
VNPIYSDHNTTRVAERELQESNHEHPQNSAHESRARRRVWL